MAKRAGTAPRRAPAAGTKRERRSPPAPAATPVPLSRTARIGVLTALVALWFVLFLVQLPFYGWFDDHGHLWWLWTCLAGGVLGLYGVWFVRKRDAAIKRAADAGSAPAEQATSAD